MILPICCTTSLSWSHSPCDLHWPTWTNERIEFIGREYTAGTPLDIIYRCMIEDDTGPSFELDDLVALIDARAWERPPDWSENAADIEWQDILRDPVRGGLGPFGVPGYQEQNKE